MEEMNSYPPPFWKVKGLILISKDWWIIPFCWVKFPVEVRNVEGTGYMVSSQRYRVDDFESTGYLVSRVRGTWFREYRVHSLEGTRVRITWLLITLIFAGSSTRPPEEPGNLASEPNPSILFLWNDFYKGVVLPHSPIRESSKRLFYSYGPYPVFSIWTFLSTASTCLFMSLFTNSSVRAYKTLDWLFRNVSEVKWPATLIAVPLLVLVQQSQSRIDFNPIFNSETRTRSNEPWIMNFSYWRNYTEHKNFTEKTPDPEQKTSRRTSKQLATKASGNTQGRHLT